MIFVVARLVLAHDRDTIRWRPDKQGHNHHTVSSHGRIGVGKALYQFIKCHLQPYKERKIDNHQVRMEIVTWLDPRPSFCH